MSAASAPERLMSGVAKTLVPTVDTVEKAGTVTFVNAMGLDTLVPVVRKVSISERVATYRE